MEKHMLRDLNLNEMEMVSGGANVDCHETSTGIACTHEDDRDPFELERLRDDLGGGLRSGADGYDVPPQFPGTGGTGVTTPAETPTTEGEDACSAARDAHAIQTLSMYNNVVQNRGEVDFSEFLENALELRQLENAMNQACN